MAKKKSSGILPPAEKKLSPAQVSLVDNVFLAPVKRYNRFSRTYKGLDCSGKSKVLPPTFEGIRALVNKVGESAAYAAFPNVQEPEKTTIEEDIVLDFVDDLNHAADKVERLTLLEEFSGYLDTVRAQLENPTPPEEEATPPEGAQPPEGETKPQGGEA